MMSIMVSKYLERYYLYDPFYAQWREQQRAEVERLLNVARGSYSPEFLEESAISDEVGVLLEDGPDSQEAGLTTSTVKNHRHNIYIYAKLDIITEHEHFLQYIDATGACP
jgi:hypothetical protein